MEWWTIVLIVLAVASRPGEVHLWRTGRLSHRVLTLLLVGRFPLLVGLFALFSGAPLGLTALVIAIALLPTVLMYPLVRSFVGDEQPRADGG